MQQAASSPLTPSGTTAERGFKKAILRLVKGGPERLAIEAGQIDAIIDPTSGHAILLPDAQRALIERKVGFRSLIGLAFDWYWEQDERYCFISHQGATDEAFGFAKEGLIGKALWDLPIDNLSKTEWQTLRQQLEWRVIFRDFEVRYVDPAGERRYLSISGEPIFDDRDQFKGYRGITRDITARKHSQAVVQESNRYARTILDGLGAAIAVLDQTGVVLSVNQAWRALAINHLSVADVACGSNYLAGCDNAVGDEHVDGIAIAAGVRQVIAGERALFRYEYASDSPTGRRWLALSIAGTASDDAARAIVSCEDITERKRGELLLDLERTVLRCLASADTATIALQSVIRAVCESQGWNCGRYFSLDQSAGVLRFSESWGIPVEVVEQFLDKSRGLVFRPGAGLAGRVCQSGQPLWVIDGTRDARVSSTALAPETGDEGAFVFPVTSEDTIIGVLAFSNPIIREPDDRTLKTVQAIGNQLGRFLQRQQAIEALRRSETTYRALNALSSDWTWEQDCDFRFTRIAAGSPFGAADVLGMTHWELPNVVLTDAKWAELKSHLAAQWTFCDFEFATIQPNGQCSYYLICGEPVYDESGIFSGYRGTGLDITRRKRAEIALRESAGAEVNPDNPAPDLNGQASANCRLSGRSRMSAELDTAFEMIAHFQQLAEHDKASLARELHDELGGLLIGAVMDIALLTPLLSALPDDVQQRVLRVRQALGSGIELTRRITEELHPTLLDNVGLFAAVRWQLRNVCAKSEISCTDDLPSIEPHLTTRASIALFRSAQEAILIGLERDAVTAIELVAKIDDNALSIQVRGDGANLVETPQNPGTFTLESIRHRMRALGGVVNVVHPCDGGIIVEVSTPITNVAVPAPDSQAGKEAADALLGREPFSA
jgi:PAS domain S-box-containing protein